VGRLLAHMNRGVTISIAFLINAALSSSASAHVKWFTQYDVAAQPLILKHVLSPDFEFLMGLSILALMIGALIERTTVGEACLRSFDRVTGGIEDNTELLFRVGCAFFFISIWAIGGIILTPELKTNSFLVSILQIVVSVGVLWRQTMPLSGLGIFILYAIGVWSYGMFHMADYPIFLGIGIYLGSVGLRRNFFGIRPLDIVRWGAGITLMWASVEKWAYPEWTHPLLIQNPHLLSGFHHDFFMQAAGAVEFALAFALMWTPLVRRVAAILLASMFVSAVFDFGKIDLIGHLMIIIILFAIIADSNRQSDVIRYPWLLPVGYASSLAVFLLTYYLTHSMMFGTSLT